MSDKISLEYGSGGKLTHRLIEELFVRTFSSSHLEKLGDSANLTLDNNNIAFTTDSFVISPLFFAGGSIGKLSVCGTVNDLAVAGAKPIYITSAFIIEEGFPYSDLKRIVEEMKETADEAGVSIVTGDTKVVERGLADGIYINTSGIGQMYDEVDLSCKRIEIGDAIVINGTPGDHAITVMANRHKIDVPNLKSDVAPLNSLIYYLIENDIDIKFMRDPTRGGVATTLCEIAKATNKSILLSECSIPYKDETLSISEMMGYDPLYLANEGKVIIVVSKNDAEKTVEIMRKHPLGKESAIIGTIKEKPASKVLLETAMGGKRFVDMLVGTQYPRIC